MSKLHRSLVPALFLSSAALIAAFAPGCGGDGNAPTGGTATGSGGSAPDAGGGGTGGGSTTLQSFTPKGCSFAIAPRPEYKEFSLSSATVGATPNIRRVRLGLGGNVAVGSAGRADPATSIAFAWQTDDGTLASEAAWGTDPDPSKWPAENRAQGVTWATPKSALNGQADERMHEVYVCGLSPATTYYYRVGGGAAGSEAWSDVVSFTTTPAAGSTPVTIGISGDSRSQTNDAWHLIQQRFTLAGVGLQLFSGDTIQLAPDQAEWEKWLDKAWKDTDGTYLTLSRILTLATHGNHENHTSLFFGNLVLPQDQAKFPQYSELFYSVDVGPVHIVVVDDFWVVSAGDADYAGVLSAWLDEDLTAANANRAKVPWIVTVHHHSEFSSSNHGTDSDVIKGRKYFVPIWDKHHVDLAIGGHDHNYERSKTLSGPLVGADSMPVIQPDPTKGTSYVVCAGAGAPEYTPGMSAFTQLSQGYNGSTGLIGLYAYLKVDSATLTLEAHGLTADKTDPIIDSLTIAKP